MTSLKFPKLARDPTAFGGALLDRGSPRTRRPIHPRQPHHLVLRTTRARGALSLLAPGRARRIQTLAFRLGHTLGVRVYTYANAGNHLHLLVQPRSREAFHAYIRALSGLVARLTLRAERGRPTRRPFWDRRPWTRIVAWDRDFEVVLTYVIRNALEAERLIPYRARAKPPE